MKVSRSTILKHQMTVKYEAQYIISKTVIIYLIDCHYDNEHAMAGT